MAYSPADVACGAALIRIMYELLVRGEDWSKLNDLLATERMLDYSNLEGIEKGRKIREAREMLIETFGSMSPIPAKILKGKNPQRIFWAVVTPEDMNEVRRAISELE